jgi:hypothetical protein
MSQRRKRSIQSEFEAFDAAHPQVYADFKALAQDLYTKGWRRYGAGTIYEVMRYHKDSSDGRDTEPYKLNNNYRAHYSRKLMQEEPHFAGFFEIRALHS